MSKKPGLIIWIKSTLFDHCIFGFPFRSLSFASISQVCSNPDAVLNKSVFIKEAIEKFNWNEDEANLVFTHFEHMYAVENTKMPQYSEKEAINARRFRLCLFLSFQLYSNRRGRRSSLSMDSINAQWKMTSSSSSSTEESAAIAAAAAAAASAQTFQNPHQLAIYNRSNEWALRLDFIKRNLVDILKMLLNSLSSEIDVSAFPDPDDLELNVKIARSIVDSLGYVMGAGITSVINNSNNNSSSSKLTQDTEQSAQFTRIARLSDLIMKNGPLSQAHGELKKKQSNEILKQLDSESSSEENDSPLTISSLEEIVEFFLSNITVYDEFNVRWTDDSQPQTIKNLYDITKPLLIRGAGRRVILISPNASFKRNGSISAEYEAYDEAKMKQYFRNHVIISTCKGTTIYILEKCNFIHIVGCLDVTIVLGPVVGTLTAEHCERVTVIAPCGRLRISNCVDMKFNVFTIHRPILFGDCRNVLVGPHNTNYIGLQNQIEDCSDIPSVSKIFPLPDATSENSSGSIQVSNSWKEPIFIDIVNGVSASRDPSSYSTIYGVLSPDQFEIHRVVFSLTKSNAKTVADELLPSCFFPLTEDYASALIAKRNTALEMMKLIQSASQVHGEQVRSTIQSSFKDWLVSSGNIRHVMDLARLEEYLSGSTASASGGGVKTLASSSSLGSNSTFSS